jgi:hypothetical protein
MKPALCLTLAAGTWFAASTLSTSAGVLTFGDADVLNTGGTYGTTPTDGATLSGLAPGASTWGTGIYNHSFPFSAAPGDFPGTDHIYVGSEQTGFHDGYSGSGDRRAGPLILNLNYASEVGLGEGVSSLTLGLMLSDFQFPSFGQTFTVTLNGNADSTLAGLLNGVDQTGPVTQFLSFGVPLSYLDPSHVLTVSIDQAGDGGDGWAIDFATTGVTTAVVPEPGEWAAMAAAGLLGFAAWRRARR